MAVAPSKKIKKVIRICRSYPVKIDLVVDDIFTPEKGYREGMDWNI